MQQLKTLLLLPSVIIQMFHGKYFKTLTYFTKVVPLTP